jgi:ribosomal protein L25 (general stress protein Ctc)
MKVRIELSEKDVRRLIREHLQNQVGDLPVTEDNITIQVKSTQNYKSEWEKADFRAVFELF